jgi:hypothetical protein
MESFETVWNSLQVHLKPGTEIKNWTALHGYMGDKMTVVDVNRKLVSVDAPKAKNTQVIPKAEFEKIWQVWPLYKSQRMQRQEIVEMTMFSKYIISIYYWYEKGA